MCDRNEFSAVVQGVEVNTKFLCRSFLTAVCRPVRSADIYCYLAISIKCVCVCVRACACVLACVCVCVCVFKALSLWLITTAEFYSYQRIDKDSRWFLYLLYFCLYCFEVQKMYHPLLTSWWPFQWPATEHSIRHSVCTANLVADDGTAWTALRGLGKNTERCHALFKAVTLCMNEWLILFNANKNLLL